MEFLEIKCTIFDETIEFTNYLIKIIAPDYYQEFNPKSINLPMWIALDLQRFDLVVIDSTELISKEILSQLEAGSIYIDLASSYPDFFDRCKFIRKETHFLGDNEILVENSRAERFNEIIDKATAFDSVESKKFLQKLTDNEKNEFKNKVKNEKNYLAWKNCYNFKDYFNLTNGNHNLIDK